MISMPLNNNNIYKLKISDFFPFFDLCSTVKFGFSFLGMYGYMVKYEILCS